MEGQVAQLQSALEEARASSTRQAIEAESALHDLQSQLSHVEQRLAEERLKSSQAAEVTEKEKHKVLELLGEKEKVESERRAEKVLVEEAKKKCKEVEREKRELLAVVEREVEEKNSLDGELLPVISRKAVQLLITRVFRGQNHSPHYVNYTTLSSPPILLSSHPSKKPQPLSALPFFAFKHYHHPSHLSKRTNNSLPLNLIVGGKNGQLLVENLIQL